MCIRNVPRCVLGAVRLWRLHMRRCAVAVPRVPSGWRAVTHTKFLLYSFASADVYWLPLI